MGLNKFCPGSIGLKQPKPEYKKCPNCGEEVEIWSDEVRATCGKCHTRVFREQAPSCIEWCAAAEQCVGPELYKRFMMERKAKSDNRTAGR